jgi:hypothetical protein
VIVDKRREFSDLNSRWQSALWWSRSPNVIAIHLAISSTLVVACAASNWCGISQHIKSASLSNSSTSHTDIPPLFSPMLYISRPTLISRNKRAQGTPLLGADSEKLMDKLAQMRSCWRFKVDCSINSVVGMEVADWARSFCWGRLLCIWEPLN